LDAVLPVSSATAEACRIRGAAPAQIHVVPNGIDAGRFADLPPRSEARAEVEATIPLPADALLLVGVGRQVRRKGTAWFVQQVMPRLPDDVHLAIAGEGPEEEAIRQAAATGGVAGRVHLLGRVTEQELRSLLVGGDLFVMPNVPVTGDMEGFGVVMLEAGLAGMATVGADLEGIRDVITEGVNGHLIAPLDAAAFARCIRRYDEDRVALSTLSASARAHVVSAFTWPAVADRYVGVLERLVSESSREAEA
jgi:phosphatidylinositol alpha-1,6-mannosyltransferase